ncbi:MAG: hypothetical protein D6746_07960 [Bacteroidetes bacterium]|nr:MAG: hypothetical protein D6746_07960 [Bacteroidota bacterium]
MIFLQPRADQTKQRRVALGFTAVVVAVVMFLLAVINLPTQETTRDLYRKIDYQRLVSMLPEPVKVERRPDRKQPTEKKEEPKEAQREPNPKKAPERVDLSDIMQEGLQVDLSPSRLPSQTSSTRSNTSSGGNTTVRLEREDLGKIGGIESLVGGELAVPQGQPGRRSGVADAGVAMSEGRGRGIGVTSGDNLGTGRDILAGTQGRAGSAEEGSKAFEVGLKDLSEFQGDYQNLDVKLLIEWMKRHPGPLPPGVRQHVGATPDNLTSVVEFVAGGTRYELYLMVKESLYEVHIVLVKAAETTYLVDRSFQQQSRKLRVGTASRSNGEIVSIQSRQIEAGDPRATRFYQLFLSWWDEAKKSVES